MKRPLDSASDSSLVTAGFVCAQILNAALPPDVRKVCDLPEFALGILGLRPCCEA
jgi:hypothetical protein